MKKLLEEISLKHANLEAKIKEFDEQIRILDELRSSAYWKMNFSSEFKSAFLGLKK